MIKFRMHSLVDVITNSSTVIYTYQDGSINPAKELINEMLSLSRITDKNADDIFYFGIFCEDDYYLDTLSDKDLDVEYPYKYYPNSGYGSPERKQWEEGRTKWLENFQLSIMKGEIEKPQWMIDIEEDCDSWNPSSYLNIVPKDEKYAEFGNKISALLNSISADGGRDG